MQDYSIYTGIVVQNDDPKKAGRVKVFVPGITNTLYDGWNADEADKEFSFIDQSIIPILEQLREDLPWSDCATTLFGGDSSQLVIGGATTALTQPAGQFSIPSVGSHVNIFFKWGNPRFPVYFAGAHGATEWATAMGDDYPTADTDINVHVINSSKHGLRFVDTSEREEIVLTHFSGSFAQMILNDTNWNTVDNKTETIGLNSTFSVGNNVSGEVGNDVTIHVGNDILATGDNTVTINAGTSVIVIDQAGQITINTNTSVDITTPITNINGDVQINGKLDVTGNIAGDAEVLDATRSMSADRALYNPHTHTGNLGTPTPLIGPMQ